jgi:hypothetical protein
MDIIDTGGYGLVHGIPQPVQVTYPQGHVVTNMVDSDLSLHLDQPGAEAAAQYIRT